MNCFDVNKTASRHPKTFAHCFGTDKTCNQGLFDKIKVEKKPVASKQIFLSVAQSALFVAQSLNNYKHYNGFLSIHAFEYLYKPGNQVRSIICKPPLDLFKQYCNYFSANMANNISDIFQPLVYPHGGILVLLMTLLSLAGIAMSVVILYITLKYDKHINRQTSLLTRVHNITEHVSFLHLTISFADAIRILTGIKFNHYFCIGYILQEYFIYQMLGLTYAMEAVVHYIFVRKASTFLIIKDDLICSFFWRAAICVSLLNTARYFHDLKQLPRTYYFCTGTTPIESKVVTLEVKCDEDNSTYDLFVCLLFTLTFFAFTIAVCYEKAKQLITLYGPTPDLSRRLGLVVDNVGFLIKMLACVLTICVNILYEKSKIEDLTAFPGSMVFYALHLWTFPAFIILIRGRRFFVDNSLNAYFRRMLKLSQRVYPMPE